MVDALPEIIIRSLAVAGAAAMAAASLAAGSPARRRLLVAGLSALCLLPATLWLPRLSLALPDFSGGSAGEGGAASAIGIPWFAIWLSGVAVLGCYQIAGWLRLRRLIARSAPPDARLEKALADTARQIGLGKAPRARICGEIPAPAAAGIGAPVVLLPAACARWSRERLAAALLHELAHIRHRDLPGIVLADLLCALYWFNPFAWMLAAALRREREHRADAAAAAAMDRPATYAAHLVAIAEEASRRYRSGARLEPGIAVARGRGRRSALEERVRHLLKSSPIQVRSRALIAAALVLAAAGGAAAAFLEFRGDEPAQEPPTAAVSPWTAAEVERRLAADPFPGN